MAAFATERNLLHMFRTKQEPCTSPHCQAGAKCPRAHSVVDWCMPSSIGNKYHVKMLEMWSDERAAKIAEENHITFKQTAAEWISSVSEYHRKKARDVVKNFLTAVIADGYDAMDRLLGRPEPVLVIEQLPVAQPVDPVEAELEIARREYEQKCEQIRKRAALLKEKEELLKKVNEWRERAKGVLSADQLIM